MAGKEGLENLYRPFIRFGACGAASGGLHLCCFVLAPASEVGKAAGERTPCDISGAKAVSSALPALSAWRGCEKNWR